MTAKMLTDLIVKLLLIIGICNLTKLPLTLQELTPTDIDLVQETWKIVEKDLTKNAVFTFMTLFKNFPEYQNLFKFRNVSYEDLPKDDRFTDVVTKIFNKFSTVIHKLNDRNATVNDLWKLGEFHATIRVPAHAFLHIKVPFMEILKTCLGVQFTSEVEEAWKNTLTTIFDIIMESILQNWKPKEALMHS